MRKFLSLVLALAIFCTFGLMTSAGAASAVSSVNCQYNNSRGGGSVDFYVKATSTTCKLKFTCTKGALDWAGYGMATGTEKAVYGAYEIKIWKYNASTGKTVGDPVYDKDCYNKASYTASFSATKGSYYKVRVYFWRATTTATSYYNKGIVGIHDYTSLSSLRPNGCGDACWVNSSTCNAYMPGITAKNGSGCTLYKTKP